MRPEGITEEEWKLKTLEFQEQGLVTALETFRREHVEGKITADALRAAEERYAEGMAAIALQRGALGKKPH